MGTESGDSVRASEKNACIVVMLALVKASAIVVMSDIVKLSDGVLQTQGSEVPLAEQ